MELPSINAVARLRKRLGESLHRRAAATVSFLAHLAVIGVLWSAPYGKLLNFRLAGERGSIALQASLERPMPVEQPVVERLSPVQVRVEPDHRHVDQQVFESVPPITVQAVAAPKVAPRVTPDSEPTPHEHPHPHRHEPHTHPPEVLTQSVAANSATASAAGHEKLPAPFDNPPPEYPAEAYRAKVEGTTVVRIGIRADGTVEFVEVAQTSGHASLDDAAVRAIRNWRFTPGLRHEKAAAFVLRLPIVFKL